MSIGKIGAYLFFLLMGIFGIYVGIYSIYHFKDPNYPIILGGTGIIIVITISVIDKIKRSKKEVK